MPEPILGYLSQRSIQYKKFNSESLLMGVLHLKGYIQLAGETKKLCIAYSLSTLFQECSPQIS